MILMVIKHQSLKKNNIANINHLNTYWYNDNDVIKPLYLELSQITGHSNKFNETKNKNKNTCLL